MAGPFYDNYTRSGETGETVMQEKMWYTSPRVNGKIQFRSQPYRFVNKRRARLVRSREYYGIPSGGDTETLAQRLIPPELRNKALAKFRKDIRDGNAALGVTLGQWRQSSDMIVGRAKWAHSKLSRDEARARQIGKMRYRNARQKRLAIADFHLEVIFGWQPLFQDIFAALSIATGGVRTGLTVVRGASQGPVSKVVKDGIDTVTYSGYARVCHAAVSEVSNPNAYLATKLGLINPALVVWDMIPWSWVVGMFVNANEMISSLTEDLGVTYHDYSQTSTLGLWEELSRRYSSPPYPSYQAGAVSAAWYHRYKSRGIGGLPPDPALVLRVPDFSWSLAATAFSVVTQRVKRFNSILTIPFS